MPNMSYCRFQNTRGDLYDCIEALNNGEPMSRDETLAARELARLCREYLESYDEDRIAVECDICGEPNYGDGDTCAACLKDDE